jgi:hypothetical protein
MDNRFGKVSLVISCLALLLALFTFLKTGGMNDIKHQVAIIRDDVSKARQQTEQRLENRSLLFEALYHLSDSVDSLQAGNGAASKELISKAIEMIASVEPGLEEQKREQLAALREEIAQYADSLEKGNIEAIRAFEYRIRLLRIFEENL